jgi:hypothetical protein
MMTWKTMSKRVYNEVVNDFGSLWIVWAGLHS